MSEFHFRREPLLALARERRASFATAEPFPHVVVDDFLPDELTVRLEADFPAPAQQWQQYSDELQRKFALDDEEALPDSIRSVVQQFNGQVFVEFLETLTGIRGLIPDPHLRGGGCHQIGEGGVLKVHADFNRHAQLGLNRRLNAILYLNSDWRDEYGGHLELWDANMTRAAARIAPVRNRLVVFATTSTSFHGHPDPLTPPPGRYRRSLAWYYYTAPRNRTRSHSTLFRARPGEDIDADAAGGWEKRTLRDRVREQVPESVLERIRARRSLQ